MVERVSGIGYRVSGIAVNLRDIFALKPKLEGKRYRFEFRIPNAEVQDSGHLEVADFHFMNT